MRLVCKSVSMQCSLKKSLTGSYITGWMDVSMWAREDALMSIVLQMIWTIERGLLSAQGSPGYSPPPPPPGISGAVRLTAFLHAAAARFTDTQVKAPGTRDLLCRVHSAGPGCVHSCDAIKSQQSDSWDKDERKGDAKMGRSDFAKRSFKSAMLHCLAALNGLPWQTESVRALCGVVLIWLSLWLFGKEKCLFQ